MFVRDLINDELIVINVGLSDFYDDLEAQGVKTIHVDWAPTIQLTPEISNILSKLL